MCHKGIVHSRSERNHALPEDGSSVHWDGSEVLKGLFSRGSVPCTMTGDVKVLKCCAPHGRAAKSVQVGDVIENGKRNGNKV
jgi:hypothetical protein